MTLHGDVISHVNISNVQVEDGGIYQCTASNKVGEAVHSADMRVYGNCKHINILFINNTNYGDQVFNSYFTIK